MPACFEPCELHRVVWPGIVSRGGRLVARPLPHTAIYQTEYRCGRPASGAEETSWFDPAIKTGLRSPVQVPLREWLHATRPSSMLVDPLLENSTDAAGLRCSVVVEKGYRRWPLTA
jgi:hypothetical protein